jgi:hypothetical protein
VERLGFEKTLEGLHEDRLGFVILKQGELELMLQSRASLQNDVPPIASGAHRAVLASATLRSGGWAARQCAAVRTP